MDPSKTRPGLSIQYHCPSGHFRRDLSIAGRCRSHLNPPRRPFAPSTTTRLGRSPKTDSRILPIRQLEGSHNLLHPRRLWSSPVVVEGRKGAETVAAFVESSEYCSRLV